MQGATTHQGPIICLIGPRVSGAPPVTGANVGDLHVEPGEALGKHGIVGG